MLGKNQFQRFTERAVGGLADAKNFNKIAIEVDLELHLLKTGGRVTSVK